MTTNIFLPPEVKSIMMPFFVILVIKECTCQLSCFDSSMCCTLKCSFMCWCNCITIRYHISKNSSIVGCLLVFLPPFGHCKISTLNTIQILVATTASPDKVCKILFFFIRHHLINILSQINNKIFRHSSQMSSLCFKRPSIPCASSTKL